jgi:hypothetical protein
MNLEHSKTLSTEHETPAFARVLLPAVHSIRVLVACEYSGRVRDAFTAKGFDATSSDLLPSRTPGKHYQGNVLDIINDGWDLLIGFPPCTYISNVNTKWRNDIERLKEACKAMEFFADLYSAPINRIALENPVGMLSTCFRKPDQIIQPYYFGGNQLKTTCLWLKNLPKLHHASQDNLFEKSTHGTLSQEFTSNKSHRQSHWYNNNKSERSTLFPAIANAMADQWSEVLLNCR